MDNIPDIVDLVLWFLAALSVLTCTIMIIKAHVFWRNAQANPRMLNVLVQASSVQDLLKNLGDIRGPLANLTVAGTEEIRTLATEALVQLDAKDKREMLYHGLHPLC